MSMQNRRWISASLLVAGAALGVVEQGFAETATGELWDVKTEGKIIAPGGMVMSMPPTSLKACIKPGDLPAPIDERRGCRRTDLTTSPTTASWKETCVGPPEVTGAGTITYREDGAFSGTIKYVMPEGSMTLQVSGKRTGQACTPR
jgi:hypothetical protein